MSVENNSVKIMQPTPDRFDLHQRIAAARAAYDAMSPVDKALADSDQRSSFVRGQGGFPQPDVLADEVRRIRAKAEQMREWLENTRDERWFPGHLLSWCDDAEEWLDKVIDGKAEDDR